MQTPSSQLEAPRISRGREMFTDSSDGNMHPSVRRRDRQERRDPSWDRRVERQVDRRFSELMHRQMENTTRLHEILLERSRDLARLMEEVDNRLQLMNTMVPPAYETMPLPRQREPPIEMTYVETPLVVDPLKAPPPIQLFQTAAAPSEMAGSSQVPPTVVDHHPSSRPPPTVVNPHPGSQPPPLTRPPTETQNPFGYSQWPVTTRNVTFREPVEQPTLTTPFAPAQTSTQAPPVAPPNATPADAQWAQTQALLQQTQILQQMQMQQQQQANTAYGRRGDMVTVMPFEGKETDNASAWVAEMRYQIEESGMRPHQARQFILLNLKGRAKDFVMNHTGDILSTAEAILAAVEQRWSSLEGITRAQEQFFAYKARTGEGIRTCLDDLVVYRRRGWPNEGENAHNRAVYNQFLVAMGRNELTTAIITRFSRESYTLLAPTPDQIATAASEHRCMEPPEWRGATPVAPTPRSYPRPEQGYRPTAGVPPPVAAAPAIQPTVAPQPVPAQVLLEQMTCHNCGQYGHRWRNCPGWRARMVYEEGVDVQELMEVGDPQGKWKQRAMQKPPCHLCHRLGHWKRDCPLNQIANEAGPSTTPASNQEDTVKQMAEQIKSLTEVVNRLMKDKKPEN